MVVLAVAGPFVYIHLIEGPAPSKLDAARGVLGFHRHVGGGFRSASGRPGSSDSVAGTWAVGPGSVAGYRVQEVLIGQHATAVGRTTRLSGTVAITGSTVTSGSVTADMAWSRATSRSATPSSTAGSWMWPPTRRPPCT